MIGNSDIIILCEGLAHTHGLQSYTVWNANIRLAQMEYLRDEPITEAFLRKINTTNELERYKDGKAKLIKEPFWQQQIASSQNFDLKVFYMFGAISGATAILSRSFLHTVLFSVFTITSYSSALVIL